MKFVQIMGAVANNYIDGLPKHVASPSDSCFQLIDFSDYREMTESRLLKILQTKCIVIRNMEWSDMRFDEAGLSTLSPMDAVISIQGEIMYHSSLAFLICYRSELGTQ